MARVPLKAVAGLMCGTLVGGVALRAQDVTVTPLEWVDPAYAPDQLPVENRPLKPEFPADLRNTPDPGYVILEMVTDEKGKRLSLRGFDTLHEYHSAAINATRYWRHEPGKRQNTAVATYTWCAVVFNPASADPRKADCTPRLIRPEFVVDPSRKTPKGTPTYHGTIWATVDIDATGHATAVRDLPPAEAKLIEESLPRWQFAPARRNGLPVAGTLRLPCIVTEPRQANLKPDLVPRVIHQVRPIYPYGMRSSGLRGEVLVDFVVDIEGRVRNAYVVRSLNPAFDEPALTAIRQWKFKPGSKDGVPVMVHMQVPVVFELREVYDGGDTGIEVKKGDLSKVPPEYRFDVAPKPLATVNAVYPYSLLLTKTEGKARVNFAVNEQGKVFFTRVQSADRPEFGEALRAAIQSYEFEPALKDGRPTQALMSLEQEFSMYGESSLVDGTDRSLIITERKNPGEFLSGKSVDGGLKPISRRPPVYPVTIEGQTREGEAVIEVLIDEEGRVRLPRIVSASDPAFGWSAVQAISVWRFAPPKVQGRSAVVRVRVPFQFAISPKSSGKEPAGEQSKPKS